MYMEMGVYRHQWSMTTRLIYKICTKLHLCVFVLGQCYPYFFVFFGWQVHGGAQDRSHQGHIEPHMETIHSARTSRV